MDDWKVNILGNYGLESAEMRGLESNTTVTVCANIEAAPIVVGTTRLGDTGAANTKD